MFEKELNWSGYKSWDIHHEAEKEFLWTCSTQDEVVQRLKTEWLFNYGVEFPTTIDYLNDLEKTNSLEAMSKGITAYTDKPTFNYKINSLGFRGDWELEDNNYVKIGFFGCSFTYGVGIAEEDLYVTLITNELSKKLGKTCKAYNFGIPGAPAGKITRYYSMLSNFIKFDYVICLMPHTGRIEYPIIRNDKEVSWNIIPNWSETNIQDEKFRLKFYETIDNKFLNSDYIRNINHCETIAKLNNSKIYFSSWDQVSYECLYNYYINRDPSKLLPWFQALEYHINPRILLGRDGIHPGPRSHLEFSKRALEYIK